MRLGKISLGFVAIIVSSFAVFANDNTQKGTGQQLSFFMEVPEDVLSMTHGNSVPLASFPKGIPSLAGTKIDNMLAFTAKVRDQSGQFVGVASELEDFPQDKQSKSPMVWDTLWTVMLKGRGSLFLVQQEIMITEDAQMFAEAISSGTSWVGKKTHATTYGPLVGARGVVRGGTGEFANTSGSFQEIVTLKKFTPQGELTAGIELRIWFDQD